MHCETNTRMPHPQVLINFVKQHRCQGRLPIMAVDDFRMFVGFKHELQRGPGEESEPGRVVTVPVEYAPVEKVVRRMGIDEEAFQSVHPSRRVGFSPGKVPYPFLLREGEICCRA